MAAAASLSPAQSSALFDILTHREAYDEIENFKYPGTIKRYGPPFQDDVQASNSPVLQALLSKFVLKLPGLRDVSEDFWRKRVEDLLEELCKAELSESYDKGLLGIRKTLATAVSALIEYPARGCFGGLPRTEIKEDAQYDTRNPDDVLQAWQDCVQELVYGDLVDAVFKRAAETDDLKQHSSLTQGMHEFVVVNLASFMHYTLILSPEGPTLLRMVENVHKLLPYTLVRQTLKVGNVATMISGLVKIALAKTSVATVTNWMGWTQDADEGMNLLQQIISQVLHWDKAEFKKRAAKIEKLGKDAPPKSVLDELKAWMSRPREEHEECRRQSREQNMSIVAVILSLSSCGTAASELTDSQHSKALEYLALHLSIRDRQEIVRVLCHRNPDHLTAAIRVAVDAYTPMIRHVHQAVNLSDTLWDLERFITDMLAMSKPKLEKGARKGEEKPPSVEDYVDLLHRHQDSCHKFLHQVAKNGTEVTRWWQEYIHMAVAQFRMKEKTPDSQAAISKRVEDGGARDAIQVAFSDLSQPDQEAIKTELSAQSKYLDDLHAASAARIASVIKRQYSTPYGPGAYLARWQNLLDSTLVTPEKVKGPVRTGHSRSVKEEARKDADGQKTGSISEEAVEKAVEEKTPEAPSTEKTWELLGSRYKEILAGG
ncbi:hypothetical protein K431DRAFT_224735 [Polychaeton citri CBS 116435]|uniref:Px domain containing protein n=1 Tax=Polychaeton citri CBS 116435 TaxID=1314669 RepID=A0A9P4QAL6_9PEZI|nr:hypothetical protein K431DRAFT_224735 [Polychaeton citri CBS 116435]